MLAFTRVVDVAAELPVEVLSLVGTVKVNLSMPPLNCRKKPETVVPVMLPGGRPPMETKV